jgi:glycosyltransferase 2 family protein
MQVLTGGRKKWLWGALKLLIVVVVVWCIRGTLVDALRELTKGIFRFDVRWLAAAGALYLLGTLLCGIFWYRTLVALGQNVSLARALRAYYIGHLGKYVPGKAMVVVLRAGLVRGEGVDTALAAASVFFETLTMMAVGAMLSAAVVAVWFRGQTLLLVAALGMMLVAGLPTLPPVFRRLARLVGVGRNNPSVVAKLGDLGYGTMLQGWVLTAVGWVVLGLSLWAVLKSCNETGADVTGRDGSTQYHSKSAVPEVHLKPLFWTDAAKTNPFAELPIYTAAVSSATVAGFLSFVPGGAVVREAVLTEMMVPSLGNALAVASAVLLRMTGLVAELLISGILYLGMQFSRNRQPAKGSTP